jgi:hypothetical protein
LRAEKGPRDVPTYSNMEVILAWNLREALRMVEKMRKGHFMPPPVCPREILGVHTGACAGITR